MKKKLGNRSLAILLSLITVMSLFTAIPAGSVVAAGAGETTEVVLAHWSAEDLLNAANATGTVNATTGNPIYDPELRNWVVGFGTEKSNGYTWVFSNSERTNVNWDHDPSKTAFTFDPGDQLQVVMYVTAAISEKHTQAEAAGFLTLVMHNLEDYSTSFLITKEVLENAEPAPERGEGVLKVVWDVTDTSMLSPITDPDIESQVSSGRLNSFELRSRVYDGASLAYYGIEVYNLDRLDSDTRNPKLILASDLAKASVIHTDGRHGQYITKPALAVYSGFKDLAGGIRDNTHNRRLYHAGTESNAAGNSFALIEKMSLGRLYQGDLTLRMDFASKYTLENDKKFTLRVIDEDGNPVKEETVTMGSHYGATHDDEEESILVDSGYDTQRDFDLAIDQAGSGKEYFLSIDTYNSTDLAFFGLSLLQEQAAWQADLSDSNATDGSVVLKEWDYSSLATRDGNYTSSDADGNRTEIQYTTDAYEGTENTYQVPVGIEYYFDPTTKKATEGDYTSAIVNKDTLNDADPDKTDGSIREISAAGAFGQIDVHGVSLAEYAGKELKCDMDTYIAGSKGWNPWARVFNSGDVSDENGKFITQMVDVNANGNPGGAEVASPTNATPYTGTLSTDKYGEYPYQSISASKITPTSVGGFRSGCASVWLLVNHYKYTETNVHRVFKYTVSCEGEELFTLEGEDWIQIAKDQNQRADDGNTPIRARVLWACKTDAYEVHGYKSVGVKKDTGTTFAEVTYPNTKLSTPVKNSLTTADRLRFRFRIFAPEGLAGNTMRMQFFYKDASGNEQAATGYMDFTSDQYANSPAEGETAGVSTDHIAFEGQAQKTVNFILLSNLTEGAITHMKGGGDVYVRAWFLSDYDFAAYPVYLTLCQFHVIRPTNGTAVNDSGVTITNDNSSTRFCCSSSASKTGLKESNLVSYGPAMEPYYTQASGSPSATPLAARYPANAVRTWLCSGSTYLLDEVSFPTIGQYEMNWTVQGEAGTTFTARVDRQTPKGTEQTVLYFPMDGTEQTVTLPFQVPDITDKYTCYIAAEGGDINLYQGNLEASEVALVQNTLYPSLITAQETVQAGQGVELLADVDASDVTAVSVPADTFLDLRGCTLKVRNLAAFGGVADSKAGGAPGLLALVDKKDDPVTSADQAAVILREDNGAMPLYDSAKGGYRFFELSLENAGSRKSGDSKAQFGYFLKFDHADAYTLMATGNSGLKMEVDVRWTGSHTYHHTIADTTISGFGGAVEEKVKSTPISKIRTAVTLTIGGVDALGEDGMLWTRLTLRSDATRVSAVTKDEGQYPNVA